MKKAVVLGFGKSGKSAFLFLEKKGYDVYVLDEKLFQRKADFLKCNFLKYNFSKVDLLVLSSGILLDHPIAIEAKKNGVLVIGEADLAFMHLDNRCFGITGTNGKTTITSLITFILRKNKIKAKAVGNIGLSLTSYLLDKKDDVLIVELSSFQLNKMRLKSLDAGLILNISEDHIKKHGSFENYLKSKINIQNCIQNCVQNRFKKNKLFVSEEVLKKYGRYFRKDIFIKSFKNDMIGAYLICKEMGISYENFQKGYKEFKRPLHRIEFVAKIKEVLFYNDSKSTNPESTIYAVEHLKRNIILIAGGDDKGLSFEKWKKKLKNNVKYIFLIGKCANKIKEELSCFKTVISINLKDAVKNAYKVAKKDDIILLSPGCASFDQFKNYEHRGEEFKRLVAYIKKLEKKV